MIQSLGKRKARFMLGITSRYFAPALAGVRTDVPPSLPIWNPVEV